MEEDRFSALSSDEVCSVESFNVTSSFKILQLPEENSLEDASVHAVQDAGEEQIVRYWIIQAGNQQGKPILVDTLGYTYTKRWQQNPEASISTWVLRCKAQRCPVSVLQRGDIFSPGSHAIHTHPANPGSATAVLVAAEVKTVCKTDIFRSASATVEEVMTDRIDPAAPTACFPKPANLVRTDNRARQAQRPTEPSDLAFQLIVQSSCQKTVGEARHLVFMTTEQCGVLDHARTWYLDGTFKVVHKLFVEMFSVHSFVCSGQGAQKQVPPAFALMSQRSKKDYHKVLKALKKHKEDIMSSTLWLTLRPGYGVPCQTMAIVYKTLLLVVIIFVKRQIMRFSLSSHRGPHVPIGHSAPRSLQTEIEQQLTHASNMKHEPRLLGDDDYRLKFLTGDNTTGERCTYIYRMKAVDALAKLDEQLRKIECRRVRPPCGSLKEYILSLRDPPQAPLKGASVNLCRAFAAAYENAQYGLKDLSQRTESAFEKGPAKMESPFGETEYNNLMTLLHELLSCIRHKGMKSKKASQSSSSQHKQHVSTSRRSLPTSDRSGGSLKARGQAKPLKQDQSMEASTSQLESHAHSNPAAYFTAGQVSKRSQPRCGARPEEMIELIEKKRASRGSDVGSDTEKVSRTRTSNPSSGVSDETQPLMLVKLMRQKVVSDEMV